MFCSNCGSEVSGNFCTNCGAPIGSSAPTPTNIPEPSIEERSIITRNGKSVNLYSYYLTAGKSRLGLSSALVSELRMSRTDANMITDAFLEMITDLPNPTLLQRCGNQLKRDKDNSVSKHEAETAHLADLDAQGICYCPKCHSTSVSGNKKGFGIGKAVVGAAMTGGIGLVAGNLGAKKIRVTCLKCGHQWWAGK